MRPTPRTRPLMLAGVCFLLVLAVGSAVPAWSVLDLDPYAMGCPPIRQRPLWELFAQLPLLVRDAEAAGELASVPWFYLQDLLHAAVLVVLATTLGGMVYWFSRPRRCPAPTPCPTAGGSVPRCR